MKNRLFEFIDLQYDARTGELIRATKRMAVGEDAVDARLKIAKRLSDKIGGRPISHNLELIV